VAAAIPSRVWGWFEGGLEFEGGFASLHFIPSAVLANDFRYVYSKVPFASRLTALLTETKVESGDVSKQKWHLC
jgi:hypothetical protein